MATIEDVTSIDPRGLGLVLLVVTLFITPLTVVVIALRCGVRLKHNVFGMDDALMVVGWALFMVVASLVSKGTYYGLGARDERLNDYLVEKSKMASICVTLLRIAVVRSHRIITWITLATSCLGALASIATIVRLPYIKFYADTIDYPYNVGNITLCRYGDAFRGTTDNVFKIKRIVF
ncbi:unnamed protein product [Clonostachys chloroleuca]|uniref:Integral membrane protein n=1 Tax=Clonostachys chloroleuca TaxID=1926264 RepID=A0AA35M3Y2_9HYPO|nr:unnamed protein product [Clonostachys chloroleuca]